MNRDLTINREQKKSSSFVRYSDNYADVLNRALNTKPAKVTDYTP